MTVEVATTTSTRTVLEVSDLQVDYATPRGRVAAVRGIDLHVKEGEILGLIGESGSGKTTAAMACLRLLPPPGRVVGGRALLNGDVDLLALHAKELREIRWRELALIPQGALNSLNPVMRVKNQLVEVIRTHEGRRESERALAERLDQLLALVGLPTRCLRMYPHELSGGMKQRICIAMAIALEPSLIVADEPTSALDVIVQRVVAETLLEIKRKTGVSVLLIGHDIGLMAQLADRVAVMYGGRIVETGPAAEVLGSPRHPYTQLLIRSVPAIGRRGTPDAGAAARGFEEVAAGCAFAPRCPSVMTRCRQEVPELEAGDREHAAACFLPTARSRHDRGEERG